MESAFLRAVNVCDHTAILAYMSEYDPQQVRDENGQSALHIATDNNSRHILELLVQHEREHRGESVAQWINARTNDGRTCLHIAARQGYLVLCMQTLAEVLVSLGADATVRSEEGSTALHEAALGNHPALVAYLHEELSLSPELRDYQGNTPLHYAALEGSELALAVLLKYAPQLIDSGNAKGHRPLHMAAANGQLRTTKVLLAHGADINLRVTSTQNDDFLTPRALARQYYQEQTAIALEQPAILSLCFLSGVPVMRPSFLPVAFFLLMCAYVTWVVALQWFWVLSGVLFVIYLTLCVSDPGVLPQSLDSRLYV